MASNEDRNMQAAMCYGLLFFTGVFYLITSKDQYVRFHALQSIVVFGILTAIVILFNMTVVLASLSSLITILIFVLWLILIYKAWSGEMWEVPVLGTLAKKWSVRS